MTSSKIFSDLFDEFFLPKSEQQSVMLSDSVMIGD